MKILDMLYDGQIYPAETVKPATEKYQRLNEEKQKLIDELREKLSGVPFPKKQTQKKLRKPNEAKEINQPAQSGKQNAREPATPKQSGDANDYKKPQCTQKCRPEPELGKQNAAGE